LRRETQKPAIPDSYRPRGAADPARTSRSQLDRHAASVLDRRDRKNAAKMSILREQIQKEQAPCLLTQYNYLLPLKGNQPTLEADVEDYFRTAPTDELVNKTTVEKGHGRIETRT
jgi:hypothetical protein